jgi:hypothetical protein
MTDKRRYREDVERTEEGRDPKQAFSYRTKERRYPGRPYQAKQAIGLILELEKNIFPHFLNKKKNLAH